MSNHAAWALYFRVSNEEIQHPEFSIPAQRRSVLERLVTPSELPVYREYSDVASGKTTAGRSAFQEMLRDARAGHFSHVAVQSWERFGRNLLEALLAEHELSRIGIQVCAATMAGIDSTTPGGWLTKAVRQVVAQWDNMQRAELVRDRMQERMRQGRWVWKAPDGYRNTRLELTSKKSVGRIEIDQERMPLIRSMFKRYASGDYTLDSLAAELNAEGYRQPLGGLWTTQGVHRILTNEFYAGWCVSKRWQIRVQGEHAAGIDQETFDACQAVLLKQRKQPKSPRHVYPLGRVLWSHELDCRFYNGTFTGERCDALAYHYTWRNKGPDGRAIYVQARVVEAQIPGLLQHIHVTEEEQRELRREYARLLGDAMEREWPDEQRRLRRQESKLRKELGNLVRLATKGMLTDQEFAHTRAELATELATVQERLGGFTRGKLDELDRLDQALHLLGRSPELWPKLTPKDKRALVELIFKRIVIDREGQILQAELWPPLDWLATQVADGSEIVRLSTPERIQFEPLSWPLPALGPALARLLAVPQ